MLSHEQELRARRTGFMPPGSISSERSSHAAATPLKRPREESSHAAASTLGTATKRPRALGDGAGRVQRKVWEDLLECEASVRQVRATAAGMAARALADVAATVEQQAAMWGGAVPLTLRRPMPYDTSDSSKPGLLLELLQTAESVTESEPLFERVWGALNTGMGASMQSAKMVLLSGVSGSGKSKVAFDIGREYAFVVLVRIWENMGKTPAWALLKQVLANLQAQWRGSTSADADADAGTAPLKVLERDSALACVLLLLSCHLELALMV